MNLDLFLTKNFITSDDAMSLCEVDEITFQNWKENGIPHPYDKLIAIACGGDISHISGWAGWRIFPHKIESPAGWLVYADEIESWVAKYGRDRNTGGARRRDKFRRIHERAIFFKK